MGGNNSALGFKLTGHFCSDLGRVLSRLQGAHLDNIISTSNLLQVVLHCGKIILPLYLSFGMFFRWGWWEIHLIPASYRLIVSSMIFVVYWFDAKGGFSEWKSGPAINKTCAILNIIYRWQHHPASRFRCHMGCSLLAKWPFQIRTRHSSACSSGPITKVIQEPMYSVQMSQLAGIVHTCIRRCSYICISWVFNMISKLS